MPYPPHARVSQAGALRGATASRNVGIASCLATYVDASGQQKHQQHDDEYPSPNGHFVLLVLDLVVASRAIPLDDGRVLAGVATAEPAPA